LFETLISIKYMCLEWKQGHFHRHQAINKYFIKEKEFLKTFSYVYCLYSSKISYVSQNYTVTWNIYAMN